MHNRVGWMAAGLCCSVVAGCGSANGDSGSRASGVDAALTSSAASCAGQSAAQDRAHAHLIFDATTLPGPSDPRSRTLLSPAHFRVSRYLKGHGPTVVRVQTAVTRALGAASTATSRTTFSPAPASDGSSTDSARAAAW